MTVRIAAPERPYKGLRPFEATAVDALLFFGRDGERELIAANLMAARLTVLYGASGVGKSSVLRAGVVQHLREQAREAAGFVVGLYSNWSEEDPIEGIAGTVRAAVTDVIGADPGDTPGTLAERLMAWSDLVAGDVYLVLDQVDEYFLYHGAHGGPLLEELPALVNEPGLRVNVLLGIREDALARLDVFKARIPSLFANYLRLDRLGREAAREAIVGPLQRWSGLEGAEAVEIEAALVNAILDEVAIVGIEGNDAGTGIEPPYLQVVLERIWDAECEEGSDVLRLETLERLGGARHIVGEHLDRALESFDDAERGTAVAMFEHLVTPSGAKVAHDVADLAGYAGVDDATARRVATKLVDERILRPVEGMRGDGARVEIFHDVLAAAVADWGRQYRATQQLEVERAEAQRRHRRLSVVAVVALLGLAAMTAVAIYAIVQQQNASDARGDADAREQAARALVALPRNPVDALRSAVDASTRSSSPAVAEILRKVFLGVRQTGTYGDGRTPVTGAALLAGRVVTGDERGRTIVYEPDGSVGATFRAPGPVEAVAASRDGLLLVAAAQQVTVSRMADGRCCRAVRMIRFGAPVHTAVLENQGAPSRFAVASGRSVSVWSRAGRLLWRRTVPGVPSILSLGARGLLVAAPTAAWLLDAASGKQVAVFQFQRTDTLLSAAYSEKLGLVVTGHRGHEARAWDAGNGKQVATLTGHTGAVVDVAFSRAGEPALATASTSGAVRIFDPSQVPGRTMLTGLLSGHTLDVLSVGFGSGEEVVTTSVDRTARVWTRDGQTLAILAGHTQRVTDAELAGLTALTWSPDGTARTWAWAPDPRVSRAGGFSSEPATAAIAGAAAVAVARVRNDGELLASARRKTLRVPAIGAVQAVAMSADGSTVATGHERGVALWSSASGAQRRLIEQRQPVSMAALSADGGTVVAGTRTGGLEVWGEQPAPREIATGLGPIAGGTISSDGRYVAAGDTAGAAGVWELSSGRLVARLAGHRKAVTGMAFSADSQFVGAGSYDHEVRVWRVADGSLVHTLPHTAVASGLAFSPDGRWVVTAGPQRAVVWEMRTGNPVVKLAGVAGKGQFLTVGFSPDGRTIHTVESDGDVGSYACVVCGSIDEVRAAAQERLRRLAP